MTDSDSAATPPQSKDPHAFGPGWFDPDHSPSDDISPPQGEGDKNDVVASAEDLLEEAPIPADISDHLRNLLEKSGTRGRPEPEEIARFRQAAMLNLGEMNLIKVLNVAPDSLVPDELAEEYLAMVRAVYARPADFDDACQALQQPGSIVVLPRNAGTGRIISAHALLAEMHYNQDIRARVGPLTFGGLDKFPAKRLPQEDNWCYVLELPADEEGFQVSGDFGASLKNLIYPLQKRNSRLVVLTTPDQWDRIKWGAPSGVVQLTGEATAKQIAERWLLAEDPEFPVRKWLDDPEIDHILQGQYPEDALEIVDHIRSASRADEEALPAKEALTAGLRESPDALFHRQVQSVVNARDHWESQLLEWHSETGRTSFERNYLLAAAALRDASVAHIYAQAAILGSTFKENVEISLAGQQAPGVIQMTKAIKAKLTARGTLSFARPGWDDGALEYFWTDRPLARTAFLNWLAEAPFSDSKEALEKLSPPEQRELAERIGRFAVRWAARHRNSAPLEKIVARWHDSDLWPVAVQLITSASVHTASEQYVHEVLLRWSKNKATPALRIMTVAVCAGEFGTRHTGKALRRLRHAANSQHPEVIESLREAVRTLWAEPTVRTTLFGYIISWCEADDLLAEAGRRTFGALATSVAADDPSMPLLLAGMEDDGPRPTSISLAKGWRTLLGPDSDLDEAEQALHLWMDGALSHPTIKETVLESLRAAVDTSVDGGPVRPRDNLRRLLFRWESASAAGSSVARDELRSELAKLLDKDLSRALDHALESANSTGGAA
ncbi:hypothetical protein MOV08_23015 [Streptomyces yunnanensis]|uniref:HEAT repeat-containing protein n=1 Tax=Streptomyces yunnanensis TaxID=156453 RepID=A0ABY8AAD0_9ACTN|nr:hypothetical protein [Streptomyces yunnanensis]WEB41848.1 hypothetical protein MOV08_23015 [Streptomyces yunnanensis]